MRSILLAAPSHTRFSSAYRRSRPSARCSSACICSAARSCDWVSSRTRISRRTWPASGKGCATTTNVRVMASASRVRLVDERRRQRRAVQRRGVGIERFDVPLDSGDHEARTLEGALQRRAVVPVRWRCRVRRQQAGRRPAGEKPEPDSAVHDVGNRRHDAAVGAQVLAERRQHPDRIPHVLEQPHGDDGVELRAVERRIEIQRIGIADDDAVRERRGLRQARRAASRPPTRDTRRWRATATAATCRAR